MVRKRRKRCRRHDIERDAHSLTFTCFRNRPFLIADRTRHWLVEALELARETHRLDLWAYVIMPEHVHLLIYPRERQYSISAILSTIKQPVAKKSVNFLKRTAPSSLPQLLHVRPNGGTSYRFWQRGGGYDRNVWSPKYAWETVDYFHANPIRRGLCRQPIDWPWSSARFHAGLGDNVIEMDIGSMPDDPRQGR